MAIPEALIDSLMNFDAIAEAEELVPDGDDYLPLGLLFHMNKSQLLNEVMDQTGDTKFSENYIRYCEIAKSLGFEQIYEEQFPATVFGDEVARTETFRIFWHPEGVLLTVESFGENTNSANMYYNVRLNENAFGVTSSGSCASTDHSVWSGSHDVREGLKHKFNKLRNNGYLFPEWINQPFLWLVNYSETQPKDYDCKAINSSKIAQFPDHVKKAITPIYYAWNPFNDELIHHFGNESEAWKWIEEHEICSDCQFLLAAKGYWRTPNETDGEWNIKDGQVFEYVYRVDQTNCGSNWKILTGPQLNTIGR